MTATFIFYNANVTKCRPTHTWLLYMMIAQMIIISLVSNNIVIKPVNAFGSINQLGSTVVPQNWFTDTQHIGGASRIYQVQGGVFMMNNGITRCSGIVQKRLFSRTRELHLNRFLFDLPEIDDSDEDTNNSPTVTLPATDYRTKHAAGILNLQNGETVRAGIVTDGMTNDSSELAGLITDTARITWIPEGKIKKPQPTKTGKPPGSLQLTLGNLTAPNKDDQSASSSVSLILALPRPLQLGRILTMIAQLGVDTIVLCGSKKVPKDYFGSHLFRKPGELRRHLVEGLCQAGDVRLPNIIVAKSLKIFLEDDLESVFPSSKVARVIAHPFRRDGTDTFVRMRNVKFPQPFTTDEPNEESNSENDPAVSRQIVLAVGPEGGWDEGYELDLFKKQHGFQQVTLGTRILRSDVAIVSLISLAQDACAEN